jgi:hypothetical protein
VAVLPRQAENAAQRTIHPATNKAATGLFFITTKVKPALVKGGKKGLYIAVSALKPKLTAL